MKNIRSKMITFIKSFRNQNNSTDIKTDIHTSFGPRSPKVIQREDCGLAGLEVELYKGETQNFSLLLQDLHR